MLFVFFLKKKKKATPRSMDVCDSMGWGFRYIMVEVKPYVPWIERTNIESRLNSNVQYLISHMIQCIGVFYAIFILGTIWGFRIFTGAMAFANYMWTIFFIIPVVYYTLYRIDNKCGMRILLYLISIFNICTTSMIFTCTFNIPLQERQDMLISAFVFGFVTFLLIAVAVIANMLERVFLSGRDTNDPEVGLVESG
jgi:hypothetical protein